MTANTDAQKVVVARYYLGLIVHVLLKLLVKVQYRGYTLGKCEPSGGCVGTPKASQDCSDVINCHKYSTMGNKILCL